MNELAFRARAVDMMKQGAPPDAVWHDLVGSGLDGAQATQLVDQLLALKRAADACDPQRLRAEVLEMFWRGAPSEAALHHLLSAGIAEEHARPEVDRLFAEHQRRLATMRPCDRCRKPMDPAQTYFDIVGNQVCRGCHANDQIADGARRVEEARLEAAGVPLRQIQENNTVRFCPRCQDHTAVCRSATHYMYEGLAVASRTFQCTRCGLMQ
jgi:hypothetical protein